MTRRDVLETIRGGLVVSCQPVPGGPLDRPEIVAAFARAALDGGAAGLRIEGLHNVEAVRRVTEAPIIGLVKTDRDDTAVRITSAPQEAADLLQAGADIVAFDATDRPRPAPRQAILDAIRAGGGLAMADCAGLPEARDMAGRGCEVLGTTLSGYTGGAVPEAPDLDLVAALSVLGAFTIAEGRYHRPEQAADARARGADAVVVGSAITRPEHVTAWFVQALHEIA